MATVNFCAAIIAVVFVHSTLGASVGNRMHPFPDGRIVGGNQIDIRQAPYQVSLQRYYHFCGGSLISKQFVLTAAHCTGGAVVSNIKVRIGSTYSAKDGILVTIRNVFRHENYSAASIDYDFSLLELEDYDSDSLKFGFVSLPAANDDVADGELLTVSGWGNTQNASESKEALRAVTVPKVNQSKCFELYEPYGKITQRMICAGLITEGGKDACQGDSGGPLVDRNRTLVGVVSWGFGCAKPNFPGVYSRVASVRNWIKEIANV